MWLQHKGEDTASPSTSFPPPNKELSQAVWQLGAKLTEHMTNNKTYGGNYFPFKKQTRTKCRQMWAESGYINIRHEGQEHKLSFAVHKHALHVPSSNTRPKPHTYTEQNQLVQARGSHMSKQSKARSDYYWMSCDKHHNMHILTETDTHLAHIHTHAYYTTQQKLSPITRVPSEGAQQTTATRSGVDTWRTNSCNENWILIIQCNHK